MAGRPKGTPKTGGRPKGTPNKRTTEAAEAAKNANYNKRTTEAAEAAKNANSTAI